MMKEKVLTRFFFCFSFLCALALQSGAQRVAWYDVPDAVQESFHLAHPNSAFRFVRWEWTRVGYCARYNFPFNEVSSLFQSNGEWVSTRWVIPEANLPLKAHDFISAKYAFYELRSCTYEEDRWQGRHYYALLSIKGIEGYMTEVCFDLKGNVVGIDGNSDEDWDDFEPLNEEEVLLMQQNQILVADPESGSDPEAEDGSDDSLPIGFFAWKEDFDAIRQKKLEARAVKSFEKQNRKLERIERRQSDTSDRFGIWLADVFSFLQKKAKRNDSLDLNREIAGQDAFVQAGFEKEKERRTQRLYRPQSRREFVHAQVLAQSKTAQKKQEENNLQSGMETDTLRKELSFGPGLPGTGDGKKPGGSGPDTDTLAGLVREVGTIPSVLGIQMPVVAASVKTVFPDIIKKAFDRRFPRAENVKYYRDTNSDYRAVFNNFGQRAEAVFLKDGTHITTALFFGKKEMSYPIRQYLENSVEKLRFVTGKRVVYESRYRQRFTADKKPQNYYQVVVWVKDKQTRSRRYYLLTFNHKAHFVSSTEYDYVGSR